MTSEPLAPDGADATLATATAGFVRALREVSGDGLVAVLLFGSRLTGTTPDRFSAYDLVVIVDAYGPFYRGLSGAGLHRRSPWLLALLAKVLAPNVIAFDPGLSGGELAKCMILTRSDFERSCSDRARDHFVLGRMAQRVEIVFARSQKARAWVDETLAAARRDVLRWAGPWLEEPLTAQGVARGMISLSYASEFRPESRGRSDSVFEAQRDDLVPAYRSILEQAEREGLVRQSAGGWNWIGPPAGRRRLRFYFLVSRVRATARWLKHSLTFNDWITYVQRKIERRTGMSVEVTRWERRLPYLLLWPKVIRVVLAVGRSHDEDDAAPTGPVPEAGGS